MFFILKNFNYRSSLILYQVKLRDVARIEKKIGEL